MAVGLVDIFTIFREGQERNFKGRLIYLPFNAPLCSPILEISSQNVHVK